MFRNLINRVRNYLSFLISPMFNHISFSFNYVFVLNYSCFVLCCVLIMIRILGFHILVMFRT